MNQFEIIMSTANAELPSAIGNFAELKAALSESLEKYRTLVVSEGGIKAAEKDRASLRKLKEQIETYRKDAKASYLEKFSVLEGQCKELSGLIDEPITVIDTQIKTFEEQAQLEKASKLLDHFNSLNPPGWLQLEDILNPKWKNKTATLAKLKEEISESVRNALNEYAEIQSLYGASVLWAAINTKFMETKSKSQTLVYAAQLERQHSEDQKRAEAEQKAREETARSQSAQIAPVREEEPQAVSLPETVQSATQRTADTSNAMLTGMFRVECTADQLRALAKFMKDTGIRYSVIKE